MSAKDLIVKPINSKDARRFIKATHYSGKVVNNSSLNLGVFWNGKLEGVMQYGSPLDKRKILHLVKDTGWNEMLELNRMAFSDILPRNSESRALSVSFKLIKKNYPHIKWILSFSDGTQSGDGIIYRASGFVLTKIQENNTLYLFPTGDKIAGMTIEANWSLPIIKKQCDFVGVKHKQRSRTAWRKLGATPLAGFQLRYIYFIDKSYREKLTVPEIPFSKINEMGAGMYKGLKRGLIEEQQIPSADSGASPTSTLHIKEAETNG